MPTILRSGQYRFYFYSSDRNEPHHIHVQRERAVAKFWLDPVQLEHSKGYRLSELRRIQRIIEHEKQNLEDGWNEFFGQ